MADGTFATYSTFINCFFTQALTAPPNVPGLADQGIPGLQLALATGATIYFLRENKKAGLGAFQTEPAHSLVAVDQPISMLALHC